MHRSTNPIQAPKRQFKIKWADLAAFAGVAAISVVSTLAVVNVALGPTTIPSPALNPPVVTTDATWTNEDCTANLTAWTRDAQQMIEDMDSRWAASAPYTSSARTDNIDPMTGRLNYILSEVCK